MAPTKDGDPSRSSDAENKTTGPPLALEKEVQAEVDHIEREFEDLRIKLKAGKAKVKEFRKYINLTAEIQEDVKRISLSSIKTLAQTKEKINSLDIPDEKKQELLVELQEADSGIKLLREVRPETRSFFTRLLLGRVNVKAW
eukprot:CAMPEP_0184017374 /NCGR_PEP_ID=MMETSP0954-20121128/7499_1 /TAXON_ID=627963 /ORGANISM="Aplanochytrium sp, Strain PBS07" /LENGTH=141 /DNA_ID=CAMNT_0026298599 /DNA_START=130 /DNA_END=552 /DNA_ORIENTATION=-